MRPFQLTFTLTTHRSRCIVCDWTCGFDLAAKDEAELHAIETGHEVALIREQVRRFRHTPTE